MTNDDRVQNICRMGYEPREAQFLCLAALHSGYFLRRQYRRFLGGTAGDNEIRLIRKLFTQKHARQRSIGLGTKLVHLCSHPFYRAVGQPDNRHRRPRGMTAIQAKVMGLDFVLAHSSWEFLATEEEKVEHFHRTLGFDLSALPSKVYRSPSGAARTIRYFVDKFPLARASRPTFVYIDAPSVSCSGFETYLRQYFRLILALGNPRVCFATDQPHKIPWARNRHQALLISKPLRPAPVLRFFRLEKLYRDRSFDRLSHQDLIDLREARFRFRGQRIEELFQFWLTEGDQPLRDRLCFGDFSPPEFMDHTFEESYGCFEQW